MQEFENNQVENKEVSSEIPMREYFAACWSNWKWFVVSFLICATLAVLFAKSRTKEYSSSAYVLIKSSEGAGNTMSTAMFTDLGLIGDNSSAVENEIYVMKSTQLMDDVVKKLRVNNLYFVKRGLRKVNIYGQNPIEVILPADLKYTERAKQVVVRPLNENEYEFETDSLSWTKAKFGEVYNTEYGEMSVVKTPNFSEKACDENIYVSVSGIHARAVKFCEILDVKKADRETVVLQLSFTGSNYKMCQDILNNLIEAYNEDVINDKNRAALATESFIVDRINAISKDLGGIDSQIERFKSSNNMPDLQKTAEVYMREGSEFATNVAEAEIQLSLVQSVRDYMLGMKENDLIPANTGIADDGINALISAYNKEYIEYSKMASVSGDANPVTIEAAKALSSMKANILRSIENLSKTLEVKVEKTRLQERSANRRIASVPTQEKEIIDVLRQQEEGQLPVLYNLQIHFERRLLVSKVQIPDVFEKSYFQLFRIHNFR